MLAWSQWMKRSFMEWLFPPRGSQGADPAPGVARRWFAAGTARACGRRSPDGTPSTVTSRVAGSVDHPWGGCAVSGCFLGSMDAVGRPVIQEFRIGGCHARRPQAASHTVSVAGRQGTAIQFHPAQRQAALNKPHDGRTGCRQASASCRLQPPPRLTVSCSGTVSGDGYRPDGHPDAGHRTAHLFLLPVRTRHHLPSGSSQVILSHGPATGVGYSNVAVSGSHPVRRLAAVAAVRRRRLTAVLSWTGHPPLTPGGRSRVLPLQVEGCWGAGHSPHGHPMAPEDSGSLH